MPDPSDGAARRRHPTSACPQRETAEEGRLLPVSPTWLPRGMPLITESGTELVW